MLYEPSSHPNPLHPFLPNHFSAKSTPSTHHPLPPSLPQITHPSSTLKPETQEESKLCCEA